MQIVIPMAQLVLVGVAFGLCFYLFVSLKREIYQGESRRRSDAEGARSRLEALEQQLADLKKELESMSVPAAPVPAAGLNLNKRTQALRMMKLGEGPEHIAAALSLPRKEVELLVKVQRLLLESSNPPTA